MTVLVAVLVAAVVVLWLRQRRALALFAELADVARDAGRKWVEADTERAVYADAFLSVVESLLDEDATDEQRGEAIQRVIDSVHDYVAVQQEHRED